MSFSKSLAKLWAFSPEENTRTSPPPPSPEGGIRPPVRGLALGMTARCPSLTCGNRSLPSSLPTGIPKALEIPLPAVVPTGLLTTIHPPPPPPFPYPPPPPPAAASWKHPEDTASPSVAGVRPGASTSLVCFVSFNRSGCKARAQGTGASSHFLSPRAGALDSWLQALLNLRSRRGVAGLRAGLGSLPALSSDPDSAVVPLCGLELVTSLL